MLIVLAIVGQVFGTSMIEVQVRDEVRRPVWRGAITIAISSSVSDANPNIVKGSDVSGAVQRSIQAWRNASGLEIKTIETARLDVSPSGNAGDGVSLLTMAPTSANTIFFSRSDDSPAKTRVFYNRRNYITEADIVLNPAVQFSTDGSYGTFDLEAVLTHEIGHLLGLRHSFVPGSIMYDTIIRNGAVAKDNIVGTISSSDVSELRSLYQKTADSEDCCGEVVGRVPTSVRKDASYEVWAENTVTGDVAAATTALRGRSFRLAGLEKGKYSVFAQAFAGESRFEVRDLGEVEIVTSSRTAVQLDAPIGRQVDGIVAVGMNGMLADRSISLSAGTQVQIMVAVEQGRNSPTGFEFHSPFVFIDPASVTEIDHADGVRTFMMNLLVDEAATKGNYSICSVDNVGSRSCLAGAVKIR